MLKKKALYFTCLLFMLFCVCKNFLLKKSIETPPIPSYAILLICNSHKYNKTGKQVSRFS